MGKWASEKNYFKYIQFLNMKGKKENHVEELNNTIKEKPICNLIKEKQPRISKFEMRLDKINEIDPPMEIDLPQMNDKSDPKEEDIESESGPEVVPVSGHRIIDMSFMPEQMICKNVITDYIFIFL